jgi:hypothetical protein
MMKKNSIPIAICISTDLLPFLSIIKEEKFSAAQNK